MSRWWLAIAAGAAAAVSILIGLFSQWSSAPRWLLPPPELGKPGKRIRFRVAFLSTAVAALALAFGQAFVLANSGNGTGGGQGSTTPPDTRPSGAPTSSVLSTTSADRFLDQMPVDLGAGNIRTTLPRDLDGKPGYDHPVVIPCATGQPTDQFREVSYSLRQRWLSFTATVYAYEGAPDESIVQVRLYLDNASPVERNLKVGTSGTVTVSLAGVTTLRVRVTCESPNASAIFAGAWLKHS